MTEETSQGWTETLWNLLESFGGAAGPSAATPDNEPPPQNDRTLVNHVWINLAKTTFNPSQPACAIELANIKFAVENANKYPEADFRIWIDSMLLDDYSIFCLKSFISDNARFGNIELNDLQNIPDYANDPYFVPLNKNDSGFLGYEFNRSGSRNVYARADYARILVLDHCMTACPERSRIIYSDIDCPDIRLPEALPVLDKHGVVIYDFGAGCVSHGYIGIASGNETVRKHFGDLKSQTCGAAHADKLGYYAFGSFLEKLGKPNREWHEIIGLPDLLPPVGQVPEHISYTPKGKFQVRPKSKTLASAILNLAG